MTTPSIEPESIAAADRPPRVVMRVFVYEYLTATGTGRDPADPRHGMYCEGRAMRDAVLADLGAVPGVTAATTDDDGPSFGRGAFLAAVGAADRHLIIAPETGGILSGLAAASASCGRALGCHPDAIALTADKLALAGHWRRHGVRSPATTDSVPTGCEAFPVVWKPRDGAGSESTILLTGPNDVTRAKAVRRAAGDEQPMILQEYVPGQPASVAFLCGPKGNIPLAPCFQHISNDGRFAYRGGELPIPPDLAERAVSLATRAVGCVPGLYGYVGVDLVLGDAADGSRDHAIEINPRLTTSYVGLRELAAFNPAAALLAVADGRDIGPLRWRSGRVCFAAGGTIHH